MPMPVSEVTSDTLSLASGTRSMTDGTTAVAISATSQPCQKVLVQADPDNVPDMFIGTSASLTPIQLVPGQSVPIRTQNVQKIFYKTGTNGVACVVNWLVEV